MRSDDVKQFFTYDHLPEHLQAVSKGFYDQAIWIRDNIPPSAERTLSLRKLWEAKNYAVWCAASNPAN
jgi:hypothetical protein